MLAVQRRRAMQALLAQKDAVSVEHLSEVLKVSLSTVRRDLDELAREGLAHRVHGGAVLIHRAVPDAPELDPALRQVEHAAEKQAMAVHAAALIEPGSVVLVSGGTSTGVLVPLLPRIPDIVVVTNSLDIARILSAADIDLVVLGGALARPENSLLGHLVAVSLAETHVDHVITGVYGVDVRSGLLGASAPECETDRHLTRSAPRLTVLADASKFSRRSAHRIVGLGQVTELVTSPGVSDEDLEILRAEGVDVHVVQPQDGPNKVGSSRVYA